MRTAIYAFALAALPEIVLASCISQQAGINEAMTEVLCALACIMFSGAGRAIAMIGVMVLGFGACFGKVSWGLAMTVAAGITTVFGAPGIILSLTGLATPCVL